jgi:hypothetical protein
MTFRSLALAAFTLLTLALPLPAQDRGYGPSPYDGTRDRGSSRGYDRRDLPPEPVPPAPPAPRRDSRREFVYGDRGQWYYRYLGGNRWDANGADPPYRYRFRELDRTPDYIELYDPDRQASVRIYDDHFDAHGPGEYTWNPGPRGKWVR